MTPCSRIAETDHSHCAFLQNLLYLAMAGDCHFANSSYHASGPCVGGRPPSSFGGMLANECVAENVLQLPGEKQEVS